MERFVRLVVAGGAALVVGLWIAEFTATRSSPWFVGLALVLAGVAGLAAGTVSEVRY